MTLKGGDEGSVEMLEELRNHVAEKIGPIAKPANIVFTPELPKTRSGKIMRRLLRDVAEHRDARRHDHARRPGRRLGDPGARGLRAVQGGLVTPEEERHLGVDLFNNAWTLMEKDDRTAEQDDELIHTAHASAYHWLQVGTPANRARERVAVSRIYTVLGRAEPALHHARRCLEICEANPEALEDWDLPFAHEALARAHALAGDADEAGRHEERPASWRRASRAPRTASCSKPT